IKAEDQSIVFNQTISQKDAHDIIDYCRSHNFFYLTYLNDQIIHDTTHDYMNIESELTGLPMNKVNDIKEAITGDVPKIMGVDFEENIASANQALNGKFNDQVSSTISKPYFLEFMNREVSKGKSLQRLFDQ